MDVPGLRRTGHGAYVQGAERWPAVEEATGRTVVVTVWPEATEALLHALHRAGLDWGVQDGRPWAFRADAGFGDLGGVHALPVEDALRVVEQAGAQLQRLHATGVAHGGVQPAALLLTDDGTVELTPEALAWPPVVARPEGGLPTAAGDVHALAGTTAALLDLGAAPEHVRRAVHTALSPDPAGQPSVAVFLDQLRTPVVAAPPSLPTFQHAPRTPRRQPVVAGVVALVVVAVAVLLLRPHRTTPVAAPDVQVTARATGRAPAPVVTPGTSSGAGVAAGTLRMDGYPPETLDTALVEGGTGLLVAEQLFTTLLVVGADGQPTTTGGAASGFEKSADCRTWTFHLRPGTFSDGRPADAAAFAKGFTRTVATSEDPSFGGLGGIVGSEAASEKAASGEADPDHEPVLSGLSTPDARTLVVHLAGADCRFDRAVALPAASPATPETSVDDDGELPIGNGPFRLDHRWGYADQEIVLVRNDAWSYGPAPALARVEIGLTYAGTDGTDGAQALATNAVDLAVDTKTPTTPETLARPGVVADRTNGLAYLYVNAPDGSPLATPQGRMALSYAIDRAAVVAGGSVGGAAVATSLFPPDLPLYSQPDVCASCGSADPAKARSLAAQAGLKPGTTIALQEGPDVSALVAKQLTDVLGLVVVPTATANGQPPAGEPGLFWGTLFAGPLSYDLTDAAAEAGWVLGPTAPGRRSDPAVPSLLAKASGTDDEHARADLVKQAERTAVGRDLTVIPLWFATSLTLFDPARFAHVRVDVFGNPVLAEITTVARAG